MYVSLYCCIYVLILLTNYQLVGLKLYTCPHPAICVLILLYMCPHPAIYVSSSCYICPLILLCMCPHTAIKLVFELQLKNY